MVVIKKDDFTLIPMDYNSFLNSITQYRRDIKYTKEYSISERVFERLVYEISNSDDDDVVVVDMANIISYPSRAFCKLSDMKKPIVFYEASYEKLRKMLEEDLADVKYFEELGLYVLNLDNISIIEKIPCLMLAYRREHEVDIVKTLIDAGECPLESSGLVSNYFVNTKKLFYNVDNYNYVVYSLAAMICEKIKKYSIDAFVSSSKNGAVIASILAGMLDVKEVHLIGIGPKYAMELGDSIDCIKKKKRYAYIFDFMCTGTELKIVSSLINAKEAFMPYAAGIARYSGTNVNSLFAKIDVLVDTDSLKIDYKILGNAR